MYTCVWKRGQKRVWRVYEQRKVYLKNPNSRQVHVRRKHGHCGQKDQMTLSIGYRRPTRTGYAPLLNQTSIHRLPFSSITGRLYNTFYQCLAELACTLLSVPEIPRFSSFVMVCGGKKLRPTLFRKRGTRAGYASLGYVHANRGEYRCMTGTRDIH